jgi:hypothetical protein
MLAPTAFARSYSRAVLRFLLLGLALLLPGVASAQFPGHPVPPGLRPFHDRVAQVDVVAVVLVEQVDEGRVRVRRESTLVGAPPESFEVKRSPLSPPPLATGDRALLLLRGDRPPYVFAGPPSELIRLSDAAMAARWQQAVGAAVARRGEPAALVPVYLEWIDQGPETLREIGRSSLLDLAAKHAELRTEITRELELRE